MKSLLLLLVVIAGSVWALRTPAIGILLWTWVSIMNPHRLSTGIALTFPVAQVIAIGTLLGLIFCKDKRFFITTPSALLMLFLAWMGITTIQSFHFDSSFEMLTKVFKIDLMVLIALVLLYSERHIKALVWVLVISIGFYGVKGGIFTIATGGSFRVWGPEGSYIAGNNEVALAMIITIPLMYFLREMTQKMWQRHVWIICMGLTAVSALGSQSRGAFLAIVAMTGLLWWRAKQKAFLGTIIVSSAIALAAFMPDSWHSRMDTINTYEEDGSAMGRINAWWMTWNLAKDNFFGGGFDIYNPGEFALYAPDPLDVHAAHSIYFQVLGEHGFIGLALFLSIWIVTWRWAGWLIKNAKNQAETAWAAALGAMCQVSLIGYAVGGAFLSLAYFDLPYNIMVLVVLSRRWVEEQQKKLVDEPRANLKERSI